ncbi:hypothetical protein BpHYR1_032808 [Brachionus plicatilis]|uniref:Uncharacterized protein n=1 Tax=Brachionus plicatilis TaxID=10195 RepID=A0A3M7SHC6_BRAPC|nr:hypothetical protein BpHYR1_032808 [Brachionus plicatilis]
MQIRIFWLICRTWRPSTSPFFTVTRCRCWRKSCAQLLFQILFNFVRRVDFGFDLSLGIVDFFLNSVQFVSKVSARLAQPRTIGHIFNIGTVSMKASVTSVAKHHFVFVIRLVTFAAYLAFDALPIVISDAGPVDQSWIELETNGMNVFGAGRA